MATRAVLYLHDANESKCGKDYTMKLYHHRDWYIQWGLGEQLVDMLKKVRELKDWSNSGDLRDLFEQLAKVWWFEPTCFNHTDTEYVYHITYDLDWWSWFIYKLEVQLCADEGIESLKKYPKYVMCQEWKDESIEWNLEEFERVLSFNEYS